MKEEEEEEQVEDSSINQIQEEEEVLEDDSQEEPVLPSYIKNIPPSPVNSRNNLRDDEQQDMPPNTEPHNHQPKLKGVLKNKNPQSTMNLLSVDTVVAP